MRYAALLLVLLFTSLGLQAPQMALAQEDGLTAEEKGWLDKVVSAGWSGKSVSDDVSISARSAPMMDDHLKTVLAKDKLLTEQQIHIIAAMNSTVDHSPVGKIFMLDLDRFFR